MKRQRYEIKKQVRVSRLMERAIKTMAIEEERSESEIIRRAIKSYMKKNYGESYGELLYSSKKIRE